MNFVVKSSRSQDKLIMTDLENFNTLNHARKLLWHFPCYRYEFLTIIEIMYELEMYMLLSAKQDLASFSHMLQNIFYLTFIGYYSMYT